jgi:hypothetical protein
VTHHDCGTMDVMSAHTSRTWIVQLNAKAGFRLEHQQQVTIVAGPATTLTVHGVRLRNQTCWATDDHRDGAPTFVGGFVVEAAGEFAKKDEAVSVLASLVNPYFQVLAVVANAAVEEPRTSLRTARQLIRRTLASSSSNATRKRGLRRLGYDGWVQPT